VTVASPPLGPELEVGALRLSELRSVHLLRADPSLADRLDPGRFSAAQESVVATGARLDTAAGPSDPPAEEPAPDTTLLVISGVLVRRLVMDERPRAELLGSGDVIRPWDHQAIAGLPGEPAMRWRMVRPTHVVIVDERLVDGAAPWPEIARELVARAVRRAHSLAVLLALSSLPRVEDRLSALFWHLADRWGRVTPAGVRLELPLTHELLAELVGAQRPTVTTALSHLSDAGSVVRDSDGSWLLGALADRDRYVPPFAD
jgi:hypothetical protein